MLIESCNLSHVVRFDSRFDEIGPSVDRLMQFCADGMNGGDWLTEFLDDLRLGLTEALNNVVEHAYRLEPGHPVVVELECADQALIFSIIDQGVPVPPQIAEKLENPAADEEPCELLEAPDLSAGLDALAEGGWGLMLIQSTIDAVKVERRDKANCLVLTKTLPE